MEDAKRRMETVKIINEVNLTQLTKPMPDVDMLYDNKRFE